MLQPLSVNNNSVDEHIVSFMKDQTLATLCCTDESGNPYCFTCFYAFNVDGALLYFKSSEAARHSLLLKKTRIISGTILPDKINKLMSKGIQLQGELIEDEAIIEDAFFIYHKKFPFAVAIKGKVYTIQLTGVKMTDNSLGFGKKIVWEKRVNDKGTPL